MSGVSDAPFRRLAWRFGAGLVVSEMVASEALATGDAEMRLKAAAAGLPVHAVQLAGREARWMRLAARIAEDGGADLIDINMGCPAKRVTTGYSGAALMRDLDHALRLIEAVVDEVDLPVTLKMRLGWDRDSINAPQLAARAEQAGVRMVTVHARTRCQFYEGSADWAAVRAVREAIDIPLVVNGDIAGRQGAERALRLAGADAVMVGRASYGAPWLAGAIAGASPAGIDIAAVVAAHFEDMLGHYGVFAGLRQARKHLGWYFDRHGPGGQATLRGQLMTATEPAHVLRLIAIAFPAGTTTERRAAA
ncbi:MAG: tRNA-dihydrouridine synthase [Alphaproteobacteria bacterium]|nr:MAG: tRNA-dihydrouridine synthase [Alphaproteobacteria bacterium]